jgi:hypothetical protein
MDLIARWNVQPDTVNYTRAACLLQGNVMMDVKMDGLVLIVLKRMWPSQVNQFAQLQFLNILTLKQLIDGTCNHRKPNFAETGNHSLETYQNYLIYVTVISVHAM